MEPVPVLQFQESSAIGTSQENMKGLSSGVTTAVNIDGIAGSKMDYIMATQDVPKPRDSLSNIKKDKVSVKRNETEGTESLEENRLSTR